MKIAIKVLAWGFLVYPALFLTFRPTPVENHITNNYYNFEVIIQEAEEKKVEDVKFEAPADDKIKNRFISFIKKKEGFKPKLYTCKGGATTIGFGITSAGLEEAKRYGFLPKNYKMPETISEAEASRILEESILPAFTAMVEEKLKVEIKETQKLALVSFAYNLGRSNLDNILEDVNQNKNPVDRMKKYIYAKGRKLNGLVTRREEEIKLWGM